MKRPLIGHQRRCVVSLERQQRVHRRNLSHHGRNKSRRCLPVQSILGYTCSCILYGLRHYSCHRRCHSLFLGLLWCKHHRETWGCVAGVWSQHQETKWGAKRDFYAKIQQERTSTSYSDLHAAPPTCVCLPLVCFVAKFSQKTTQRTVIWQLVWVFNARLFKWSEGNKYVFFGSAMFVSIFLHYFRFGTGA